MAWGCSAGSLLPLPWPRPLPASSEPSAFLVLARPHRSGLRPLNIGPCRRVAPPACQPPHYGPPCQSLRACPVGAFPPSAHFISALVQREAGLFAPLHSFPQFLEWILVFLPKRLTLSMHKGPMSLAAEGLGRLTAVVLVGREELAGGAKFWAEGAGELRREAAELPTGCSAGARCPLPRAAFSHA